MTRLELPFPVPLHDCFTNVKGRGRVKTSRYKSYSTEAWAMIAQQRPGKLKGAVSVFVRLVAPDKRLRDGDNLMKCLLDTLKANEVIEDDNRFIVRKGSWEWAEDGPPCVVVIQQSEALVA